MNTVDLNDIKNRMESGIEAFRKELLSLRTGRASPTLLDPVMVDAYGSKMPLNQLGTVNIPEPRMIVVQVWDKAMVKAVEKAIREAELGLNPIADAQTVRVPLPELSRERRQELAKVARKYAEESKISIRNTRRIGMEQLKKAEKDGDLSEDQHKSLADKIQDLTDQFVTKIDQLLAHKEKEILEI